MKSFNFIYRCCDKDVQVCVVLKRQRNIYYRFKDSCFYVTAPPFTSKAMIVHGLDKFGSKLMTKVNALNSNFSFEENYLFLLGEKVSLSELNIKNSGDLQGFLLEKCEEIIIPLVRKYEEIMGTEIVHKISFKHTKNQFGSNSRKTNKLSFQIELIHYSLEIIESVVVHEIAHDFERNHGKNFYNIIYSYCPNYKTVQRKLKKGIHK